MRGHSNLPAQIPHRSVSLSLARMPRTLKVTLSFRLGERATTTTQTGVCGCGGRVIDGGRCRARRGHHHPTDAINKSLQECCTTFRATFRAPKMGGGACAMCVETTFTGPRGVAELLFTPGNGGVWRGDTNTFDGASWMGYAYTAGGGGRRSVALRKSWEQNGKWYIGGSDRPPHR